MSETPESPIEIIKRGSHHLRGTLAEELASPEPGFTPDSQQLLKPHGLYQQKSRDKTDTAVKGPVLMLRGRIPGGRLSAAQYLAYDALADSYGDGSLRLTTRQSIELHGVLKGNVKEVLQGIQKALLTTQGACGDVVRNVTQAPNPWGRADIAQLEPLADRLSRHFLATSNAYTEIWLDGEKVNPEEEREPIYGQLYLPRKFKICLTVTGENLVDLYTNDLGLAATFSAGILDGFFVFVGGGMGMTHNDATTFPRLADPLGWIPVAGLIPLAEAVVGVHRDFGHRAERRHARLKYVVQEKGLDWLRSELESRTSLRFEARELPPWNTCSVLGWLPREGGSWAYGLHTPSGRVASALKQTLRALVAEHDLSVQVSPDQDLILLDIPDQARADIEARLAQAGAKDPDPLERRALACVALPLCGLAITEAERALPDLLSPLRQALVKHGRLDQAPVFRVTGCANGCARPYSAELALVGQAVGKYALYAGGSSQGDRLAVEIRQRLSTTELPELFDRLIGLWAAQGLPSEPFGDFANRLGASALAASLQEASL